MVFGIAVLLLTTLAGQATDVTGKWEGMVVSERPDGSTSENSALVILTQKGTAITGTIGGDEADQHPIDKGSIEGNKISILATHTSNGREFRIELTAEGDVLTGTVTSGDRQGKLNLKKRRE